MSPEETTTADVLRATTSYFDIYNREAMTAHVNDERRKPWYQEEEQQRQDDHAFSRGF